MNRDNWVEIKRGAEASIWKMTLFGANCIAKVLEPKKWRAEQLDNKLRSDRIQAEARTNLRLMKLGIPVSPIIFIDPETATLVMEEMNGGTIKQLLFDTADDTEQIEHILRSMGKIVATLHNNEIVHGDLTTSNFMLHNGNVRVIDFGLSYMSSIDEDQAVDLYVMERAFNSSHPGKGHLLEFIYDEYEKNCKKAARNLKRLEKVRARGRKRSMEG